jgi:recombinational DNA repair protein (RecF pathway)
MKETEIIQHVLKMQQISLQSKYITLMSRGFLFMCLHVCNTNTLLWLTSHVPDKPFYQLHENTLSYLLLPKLTPHVDEIHLGRGKVGGSSV